MTVYLEREKKAKAVAKKNAVPLDKLCEWLSEYTVPCKLGIRCEYAVDFACMSDKDCWRYVLKKWMEGLDDHKGTD